MSEASRLDPPTYLEERSSRRLVAQTSGRLEDDNVLPNMTIDKLQSYRTSIETTAKKCAVLFASVEDDIPRTDPLSMTPSVNDHNANVERHILKALGSFDSDAETGPIPVEETRSSTFERRARRKDTRQSLKLEFPTGQVGRAQRAKLRSQSSRGARSSGERDLHRFLRCFGLARCCNNQRNGIESNRKEAERLSKHGRYLISSTNLNRDQPIDSENVSQPSERQYRLQAITPKPESPKWLRWLGLGSANLSIYDQTDTSSRPSSCKIFGVQPNEIVVRSLHWMFRKNIGIVMVTCVLSWFALSLAFALVIWIAGISNPECIGGSEDFAYFSDAFILSWTTFSTVGYGCVFVGAGVPNNGRDDVLKCATINGIVSLESFFGVLFASLISAVMFVKVARVQSVAQVEYCEPICIRYGSGVMVDCETDDGALKDSENNTESQDELELIPCPVLEFRVANRMFDVHGGEIMDASVKVVAVVSVTENAMSQEMSCEDDPSGHLETKTAFSNVECQTHKHPFFKRVFLIRHKLDHSSPLVKDPIREMIKANNGYWPNEFNTARNVNKAIQFDRLLVTLQGISNADAKTVYARKVFEFADCIVGYSFVSMLYKDRTGALQIDLNLINDVVEQPGGGGEAFTVDDSRRGKSAL